MNLLLDDFDLPHASVLLLLELALLGNDALEVFDLLHLDLLLELLAVQRLAGGTALLVVGLELLERAEYDAEYAPIALLAAVELVLQLDQILLALDRRRDGRGRDDRRLDCWLFGQVSWNDESMNKKGDKLVFIHT